MLIAWLELTLGTWLLFYLVIGWLLCRDEMETWKKWVYVPFWGILPWVERKLQQFDKWLTRKFRPHVVWVDGSHGTKY